MRTLVLHAHPLEGSYSAALRDAVVESAPDAEVVRLGQGEDIAGPELSSTEHLIVVAPTWWGGAPAMLLDWVQRVLGPSIDGRLSATPSPLRSVRRLTVVTTHGSSKLLNTLQGEPGRQLWSRVVLPLCDPDATFRWIALYKLDRLDRPALEAFLGQVRAEVTSVTVPA